MPKNPKAPGETPTGGDKKPLLNSTYTVAGDPSKNYIIGTPDLGIPRDQALPFLMGRDGRLYVEKSLVPDGAKKFTVTITVQS